MYASLLPVSEYPNIWTCCAYPKSFNYYWYKLKNQRNETCICVSEYPQIWYL